MPHLRPLPLTPDPRPLTPDTLLKLPGWSGPSGLRNHRRRAAGNLALASHACVLVAGQPDGELAALPYSRARG